MKKIIAMLLCLTMCFCVMSLSPLAEGAQQPMLGDADNDKKISANDALFVLQCAVEIIKPTKEEIAVLDVDGDGMLKASDALLILQKTVNLIRFFPVEYGDGYIYIDKTAIMSKKGGVDFVLIEAFLKPEVAETYTLLSKCSDARVLADFGEWQPDGTLPLFVRTTENAQEEFNVEITVCIENHEDISAKISVTVIPDETLIPYSFDDDVPDFGVLTGTAPSYMMLTDKIVEGKKSCHLIYSADEVAANYGSNNALNDYMNKLVNLGFQKEGPEANESNGESYGLYNEAFKKYVGVSTVTIEGESYCEIDIILDPITF